MKVELTDHSVVKKSLKIEVPADIIDDELKNTVREYAKKARIPGFRAGKVPLDLVRNRFRKEIREDVRDRVVSRYYHEATKEKGLQPLGEPTLEDLEFEDGKPLSFKTTFEIMPPIELNEYKELEGTRPSTTVDDEEIEKSLEEIRQARANLIAEEGRAASTGDVVVGDLRGEPEDGEAFEKERMMIELGSADSLPAFNDALEGVKAKETKEFTVQYPDDYGSEIVAGKSVKYKVVVHEVKRRELPELDDEFAKDLGDFETLDALRARIREDLESRKTQQADREMRQSLMDKLLLANPIVLPEVMVEAEVRQRLEETVRQMMQQGMDPQSAEVDWAEMRKRMEEPARMTVHGKLLLDEIARQETLEVSNDEMDQRIVRDAAQMGVEPEAAKDQLSQHGAMQALKNQLLREKSLDLIASVANIKNEE
ncbi:MAG: trigger factor [Acidobacteriota bacterium]|nr:trigger factor [Acidobacteriota bacterium]